MRWQRSRRQQYSDLYGPTTGDKIRLADTDLYIEIEKDLRVYGEEAVYGGGKTLRDGMGYDNELTSAAGAPDLVITNVTILDAIQGVIKADVGIKNGLVCAIGKAGNPSIMSGVTPGLALGPGTDAISGEHLILTAGGIDAHVHYISPQQAQAALSNGITTVFGGGIGPTDGTNGTTITPGTWNIEMMLRSFDGWPVNAGVLGKGNGSAPVPLEEQIRAGAMPASRSMRTGAATPGAIRNALTVADNYDVQVCIHTDTLNEAGFVENTIAAFEGRTIHTYHTEGAGGGHAPDIIRVAGLSNVLPSSTNPTLALWDQLPGRVVRHDDDLPQPVAKDPDRRRLRREPRPRRNHRGGERAARSRCDLDPLQRQPGHGPHRRELDAQHADRRPHEAALRRL